MRNKINSKGEIVKGVKTIFGECKGALVCSVTPDKPEVSDKKRRKKCYTNHLNEVKEYARRFHPVAFQHLFNYNTSVRVSVR